jgi:hypothetical protein
VTAVATVPVRRPPVVRALAWLLAATAVATVVVEVLNWAYAPEGGFGLAVRTSWALLRSIGFLFLIWHVRAGRPGARPFGLILAVTTVFAVGRLIVPRSGTPALPGVVGFAVLVALCAAVVLLLYRSPQVDAHLSRPATRIVLRRDGLRREPAPARRQASGWLLTARVGSFAYGPLMLVAALVAVGAIADGRIEAAPAVALWLVAGFAISYVIFFTALFVLRGHTWARRLLVVLTVAALLVHLPLCWWLLGVDGLVRDGGPLVVAAGLTLYAVARSGATAGPLGRRSDR